MSFSTYWFLCIASHHNVTESSITVLYNVARQKSIFQVSPDDQQVNNLNLTLIEESTNFIKCELW